MKHTPGPWNVGVYEITETFKSIPQHSCVCDPVTLGLIAVCGPAEDQQSQVDADLIAAAPELLEALKGLKRGDCFCEVGIGRPGLTGHSPSCMRAKAAIGRAEGRS